MLLLRKENICSWLCNLRLLTYVRRLKTENVLPGYEKNFIFFFRRLFIKLYNIIYLHFTINWSMASKIRKSFTASRLSGFLIPLRSIRNDCPFVQKQGLVECCDGEAVATLNQPFPCDAPVKLMSPFLLSSASPGFRYPFSQKTLSVVSLLLISDYVWCGQRCPFFQQFPCILILLICMSEFFCVLGAIG